MAALRMKDGKFRILIVSDIQDSTPSSKYTLSLIDKALEKEKPDFVILLGDNIAGYAPVAALLNWGAKKTIEEITEPFVSRRVQFAVVFGNHDSDALASKMQQMFWYKQIQGCVSEYGQLGKSVGNYTIPVFGDDGEPSLILWFIDSNSRMKGKTKGFETVGLKQIEWFNNETRRLKELYNGKDIPGFVFQHIPVPEIYELLEPANRHMQGASRGKGNYFGGHYALNREKAPIGTMGEAPHPPNANDGEFECWRENGSIKAAFFGHDHLNDFEGEHEGIRLLYTPGAGFSPYGRASRRGVRVVDFDSSLLPGFKSSVSFFSDYSDEKIPKKLQKSGGKQAYVAQWAALSIAGAFLAAKLAIYASKLD